MRRETLPVLGLLSLAGAAGAQTTFQSIGQFAGGEPVSVARGVSPDGLVVVGQAYTGRGTRADGCCEAFRWTETGGGVVLDDLPGGPVEAEANAATADGALVVGMGDTGVDRAVMWFGAGPAIQLPELPGGGVGGAVATGVSADGGVIVGFDAGPNGTEGFVYYTVSMSITGIGDLPGDVFRSRAWGVSADGAVVVGSSRGSAGTEAVRWTQAGKLEGLGDLPGGGYLSEAFATSADGAVIVGYGTTGLGREAFRWTRAGGMAPLGDLPGGLLFSEAAATSADGSVIVGYSKDDIGDAAFIWTAADGLRSLQQVLSDAGIALHSWRLRRATGVSADGTVIVGYGDNPLGQTEGWIAHLPRVCRADLDGDGALTFFDFLEFQNLFAAGDLRADFTGDGLLDLFDFLEFQNQFAAGCP